MITVSCAHGVGSDLSDLKTIMIVTKEQNLQYPRKYCQLQILLQSKDYDIMQWISVLCMYVLLVIF